MYCNHTLLLRCVVDDCSGPDSFKFLQGMVTNNVGLIAKPNDALFAALLNGKGRCLFETIIAGAAPPPPPTRWSTCSTSTRRWRMQWSPICAVFDSVPTCPSTVSPASPSALSWANSRTRRRPRRRCLRTWSWRRKRASRAVARHLWTRGRRVWACAPSRRRCLRWVSRCPVTPHSVKEHGSTHGGACCWDVLRGTPTVLRLMRHCLPSGSCRCVLWRGDAVGDSHCRACLECHG